jgi:hypothetical protein
MRPARILRAAATSLRPFQTLVSWLVPADAGRRQRRARLGLEVLEERAVPDGTPLALTYHEGDAVSRAVLPVGPAGAPYYYPSYLLPPGLSFDAGTGAVSGTLAAGAAQGGDGHGHYTSDLRAIDLGHNNQLIAETIIDWMVLPRLGLALPGAGASGGVNVTGTPGGGLQSVAGRPVDLMLGTGGNESLTYTATGLPPGLTLDPTDGAITGTPLPGDAAGGYDGHGDYEVTLTVSDGTDTTSDNFIWTVTAESALTLTVAGSAGPVSLSNTEGDMVQLQAQASGGAAGASLTYGASGLPAGLAIDAATGRIAGTLAAGDAMGGDGSGNYTATATVTDGIETASVALHWSVSAANTLRATTTTLSASDNNPLSGEAVTFTAAVSAVPPGIGVLAGLVTFSDGGAILATVPLGSDGTASLTTSALGIGAHTITAVYAGSGAFAGSAASTSVSVGSGTMPTSTITSLTVSDTNPAPGRAVTLTAVVFGASPGGERPTGSVTFWDGNVTLGTAGLDANGTAVLVTSALSLGNHALTAVYAGAAPFAGSMSAVVNITVADAGTTTTLSASSTAPYAGQFVKFTANVTTSNLAAGTPTGSVTFKDGNTELATVALDTNGRANYLTSTLAVGNHPITAVYNPTGAFAGSTSLAVNVGVIAASAFIVTNTSDDGAGSLRQVIRNVNAAPATEMVQFAIPTVDPGYDPVRKVSVIAPKSSLGTITRSVWVNGFATGSDMRVELSGLGITAEAGQPPLDTAGLTIGMGADSSLIQGLSVYGFTTGIQIGAPQVKVQGCFIGTETGGMAEGVGNEVGIDISSSNNVIGLNTDGTGLGNLVSGNTIVGIKTEVGANNNVMFGNVIGLDGTLRNALPNADGVQVFSSSNEIGGGQVTLGNVISGNTSSGVVIEAIEAVFNTIQNNRVGVLADGLTPLPNGQNGIWLKPSQWTIIGSYIDENGDPVEGRNIIDGGSGVGIRIEAGNTTVSDNYVGIGADGTTSLNTGGTGILIDNGLGNFVGGDKGYDTGNVISGNMTGVSITGTQAANNMVQGNLIGTDATGTQKVGNGVGVQISAANTTVGGEYTEFRNVISGNSVGVQLIGANADDTKIQGNYIGVDATGQARLVNTSVGIDVNGATNTQIGGESLSLGNVISGNGRDLPDSNKTATECNGINVRGYATTTTIRNNYIGMSADGTVALGNVRRGIYIESGSVNTTVGGAQDSGNFIADNGYYGIDVSSNSNTVITWDTFGRLLDNLGQGTIVADNGNKLLNGKGGAIFIDIPPPPPTAPPPPPNTVPPGITIDQIDGQQTITFR